MEKYEKLGKFGPALYLVCLLSTLRALLVATQKNMFIFLVNDV